MARKPPSPLTPGALWESAVRALAGRAYSVSELAARLRRRAASPDDVAGVLARLKEYGYLDDRRYAQTFAASRLENHGFGRARVLRDLRSRRVPPSLAHQAVESAFKDTDETALIQAFLARKYRHTPLGPYLAEPKHLASVYRKLRLAGFGSSNVVRVLQRYSGAAGDLESLEDDAPES